MQEEFRAAPHRHHPGGVNNYQQTGREIHGEYFNDWLTEIRRLIDEHDELLWASGFILFVDGKGLKHMNLSEHEAPEDVLADEGKWLMGLRPFAPTLTECPDRRQYFGSQQP